MSYRKNIITFAGMTLAKFSDQITPLFIEDLLRLVIV